MSRSLVIVESPAKARTINRFLGSDTEVMACMGHVRDLPQRSMGVDLDANFEPRYELTKNGEKVVKRLKQAAAKANTIYLATDPDREGEAIAWHLYEVLKDKNKSEFLRVTFHEITAAAIRAAFDHAHKLDQGKVDAQQARRVLDRIVGYKVSPLLWRTVKKGTSAGRVQSVALRLVCEREREIQNFTPQEYWTLKARFKPGQDTGATDEFWSTLFKLDGKKPEISNQETANGLAQELNKSNYKVVDVASKDKRQRPAPPFMTSTLQQVAGARLRMSTKQTMSIAQQLYEGVELGGGEGASGLITYMRTDSLTIAKEAQQAAREFVAAEYGAEYVPNKPNTYKSKGAAQGAHEAIRPTDVRRTPDSLKSILNERQLKLYTLIWERFVASQMAMAKLRQHTLDIAPEDEKLTHDYLFRTTGTETLFPGYMRVFQDRDIDGDDDDADAENNVIPALNKNDECILRELERKQSFTEPPRRFSEATLVRELERNGVGRPSTYSSIVNTIQEREYVDKQKGRLHPTHLGFDVNDYLIGSMDNLFQVNFTADMEKRLDEIEEGKLDWTHMLEQFYAQFQNWVTDATSANAPENHDSKKLIEAMAGVDIDWEAPTSRGRRKYDDQKFFESLRKQVLDDDKKLTDKQWQALLSLAAKYQEQLPELKSIAGDLGVSDELRQVVAARREREAETEKGVSEETKSLLAALREVKFNEPRTVGKRTYDDAKFFKSLADRADGGRELTSAQLRVLKQMVAQYRNQIDNVEDLADECDVALPDLNSQKHDDQARVIALFDEITEWNEPVKRRGRVYDDREFARSIQEQFAAKHEVSERQLNAVKKVMSKYKEQIPNYDKLAAELELPTAETAGKRSGGAKSGGGKKQPPKVVGKCPECDGDLVERQSRRGVFYGCSKYPKCKYTTNSKP